LEILVLPSLGGIFSSRLGEKSGEEGQSELESRLWAPLLESVDWKWRAVR
jgi:hypothetical protein